MTLAEKIATVKTLLGNDAKATDALITVYLNNAKFAILNRRYLGTIPEYVHDVPREYDNLQIRLAERYFLKRGAEGEMVHLEDGVHRHYGSVNDEDLLREVAIIVKVK